jgi:hypothetical protein
MGPFAGKPRDVSSAVKLAKSSGQNNEAALRLSCANFAAEVCRANPPVIPAEAGIQPQVAVGMDTGFRRYDRKRIFDRGSAVLGLPALNYFSA